MKYAYFNPTDGRVIQWIDTESYNYDLPNVSTLHVCNEEEFSLQNHGEMMISNGAIIPYIAQKASYEIWNGTAWIDPRTDAEKRAAYLASMPELTKRQFNLYLYDAGLKDEVDALLAANPRAKVEFDSTDKVVRTSQTVEAMIALLGWTDEQVDQMWQQALTL